MATTTTSLSAHQNALCNIILTHLREKGPITSMEAFSQYNITRLSAIIFVLRKKGFRIRSIKMSTVNPAGRTVYYAKYVLDE